MRQDLLARCNAERYSDDDALEHWFSIEALHLAEESLNIYPDPDFDLDRFVNAHVARSMFLHRQKIVVDQLAPWSRML